MKIIAGMLSGFPASAGIDPDMQIRAYLVAIDGIPAEAVWRAAKLFLSGKVRDHNRAFAPSAASFAEIARQQQAVMTAQNRPRVEAPPEQPQPKVAAYKMRLLRQAANGSRSAKRALAEMFPDNPVIARAARDAQEAVG
ncbi:hypothetical protein AMK01_CH01071 [Rhizobium sp. N6212]|nr:hypothetical protein AMK01_CH01071 [Rhizobium sp. N6212]ANK96608.1 hypothetical protein AMK00_CH01073 [Rhizobium sp. N621]ANL02729.1 hypothetical protein AMJ99_CH01142 [Rhizobium esperanzae]ANL08778.1 hypothetical protein AMJ98_CH01063 [Rhizobium sp. N1341]ANM33581.1 hypothetical protein AMK04_CH01143 [Rhizobium sp. N871]ANM39619.1 hypothetical protein AMK03_CH01063 [Rhizobium sp. N741]